MYIVFLDVEEFSLKLIFHYYSKGQGKKSSLFSFFYCKNIILSIFMQMSSRSHVLCIICKREGPISEMQQVKTDKGLNTMKRCSLERGNVSLYTELSKFNIPNDLLYVQAACRKTLTRKLTSSYSSVSALST